MPLRKSSVRFVLTANFLFIVTLLLGLSGLERYLSSKKHFYADLHLEVDTVSNQLATAISLAASNVDHEQLKSILDSFMLNKNIVTLELVLIHPDKHIITRSRDADWHIVSTTNDNPKEKYLSSQKTLFSKGTEFGYLSLTTTDKFIKKKLSSALVNLVLNIFIIDILLFIFLAIILRKTLVHSFKTIEQYVQNIGDPEHYEQSPSTTLFHTEFATLNHAIQNMLLKLNAQYKSLLTIKNRLQTLVEFAPEAITVVNYQTGKFISANIKAQQLFNCSYEELMNSGPESFYTSTHESRESLLTSMNKNAQAALAGEQVITERQIKNKEGEILTCEVRLICLPSNEDQHIRVSYLDISQRKEIELSLKNAKEAAESSNRSRNSFLANMSHEIRNPMNSILGFTDLTLATLLTDEQRHHLQIVQQRGLDLMSILNDIIALSKINSGKIPMVAVHFSLRELIAECIASLQVAADKKMVTLRWFVTDDVPNDLRGFKPQIKQIILNLLSNALKFTHQGEVCIAVCIAPNTTLFADQNIHLNFTVKDTGIGIAPHLYDKIFEPFTQGDESLTKSFGGTGLGLTIVRKILEQMGGSIWVDSEELKGSTFHVALTTEWGDKNNS